MCRYIVLAISCVLMMGCNSTGKINTECWKVPEGVENEMAFAIFDSDNHLISMPIENMKKDFQSAVREGFPFTDIAIVSHGWNFTHQEAISHYYRYLAALNKSNLMLTPERKRQVAADDAEGYSRTYFIFVAWASITRPMSEGAKSLLPDGLDDGRLIGGLRTADSVVFHFPSVWAETSDALKVAVGVELSDRPALWHDDFNNIGTNSAHRKLSVSSMIKEIHKFKNEEKVYSNAKLHLIGHSFGAKIMTAAAIHSQSKVNETMIDSLITMNAAFHPHEMNVLNRKIGTSAVKCALCTIPKKIAIYTNYDYATGWVFDASQMFFNNQYASRFVYWEDVFLDVSIGGQTFSTRMLTDPITGVLSFGTQQIRSVADYLSGKLINIPYDLLFHIDNNEPFDVPYVKYISNTFLYFIPIDNFYRPGGDPMKRGILSPVYPAIGSVGFHSLKRRRGGHYLGVFNELVKDGSYYDKEKTRGVIDKGNPIAFSKDSIISMDMTEYFNSSDILVGAHGDMGSLEKPKSSGGIIGFFSGWFSVDSKRGDCSEDTKIEINVKLMKKIFDS